MQSSGIHCKVATQNEVRRFVLTNTDYESLLNQVSQVFGFPKDSVVIKYADDEGDFITVSSDAEVKFAIEVVKGVFRLRVERKQPSNHGCAKSPAFAVDRKVPHPEDDDESEDDESESSGDHPKWHKKDHRERMMENPAALEKCLQRLKQKRAKIQEKLVYLDSAAEKGNLGNGQHRHREKLRSKVAFISSRIERLSEVASRQPVPNPQQPQQQTTTSSPPQQLHELPQQQLPSANAGIPDPATDLSGQVTTPKKEELLAEYETLQNSITSLKFALREAHLQLQLRRTNLQAATYRRNDESSVSPVAPLPSEEQVKELKDALSTAKANETAAKAALKAQVEKMHELQHQLKAFKHSEKAGWKAAKCQEKAAWRAQKMADKHHQGHHQHHQGNHQHHQGRRNYNNYHDSFPESSPVVQGSVSV